MNWRPIETVPRDGTLVWIADKDAGSFLMRWGAIQRNGLIPGRVGMWVAPDGGMTWTDADGFGPTYWAPADERPDFKSLPDIPRASQEAPAP